MKKTETSRLKLDGSVTKELDGSIMRKLDGSVMRK